LHWSIILASEQGCTTNCGVNEDIDHFLLNVIFMADFDVLFSADLVSLLFTMAGSKTYLSIW